MLAMFEKKCPYKDGHIQFKKKKKKTASSIMANIKKGWDIFGHISTRYVKKRKHFYESKKN